MITDFNDIECFDIECYNVEKTSLFKQFENWLESNYSTKLVSRINQQVFELVEEQIERAQNTFNEAIENIVVDYDENENTIVVTVITENYFCSDNVYINDFI